MNLRSAVFARLGAAHAAPRALARARRRRRGRSATSSARAVDACTRGQHAPGRPGGRALHVRGLQLVPARRPLAVEAEGRSGGGRPRLPRRLLGPARLEGPLRERRVHRPPGDAAGEQRRPLQLHAAGRRRRSRPHRLVARHGARRRLALRRRSMSPSRTRATASSPPSRRRPARRSGSPRTGRSPSRATSPRSRRARTRASTLHHDFVVRDYEPVAAWAARGGARRRSASSRRPRPTRRTRAASTWSSSTRRPAGPCRRVKVAC